LAFWTYRFANVHVATVFDGYFALLILLLRRSARQRSDTLVHDDALLNPGTATQQPHFSRQNYGYGTEGSDEHREYGDHGHHAFAELARRHVRMVEHGHFGIIELPAVFVAPEKNKNIIIENRNGRVSNNVIQLRMEG